MVNSKLDITLLDNIIKKTIEAIDSGKKEIYNISESARRECKMLEEELSILKQQVSELIIEVATNENELKESKKKLMLVNKNHEKFTQEELKQAYEKADNLRIGLAVKREKEQYYIKRRNDLEVRLKESIKTVERADNLITHVGVALGYLEGDLSELSLQLEDMQHKQLFGLKIIKAQEEERKRVAREIHDGPAQTMSNLVLKAEICEKLLDVDIIKTKEELKDLKRIVRDSLKDVRKIIYNLMPMSLDDLGLIPTLQKYTATFQDDTGIAVTFKTRGTSEEIKPLISLTVFRIIQESLNNVYKHANAKDVLIMIEIRDTDIKVYLYDDGKGFLTEKLKNIDDNIEWGFGIISMRERVELLNGTFNINSEIDKGTRINVTIPLVQEEEATNE